MKKMDLSQNYYVRKLDENRGILFCALVLALLCTFISYPGIWYSDSYGRVNFANVIKKDAKLLLTGEGISEASQNWLTVVPSFFMAISKYLTGHVALYTFAQSFAFLSVTFLFIKKLNTSYRWLQYLLFGISPLILCVSVYYEAGVGCVTGIAMLVLLFDSAHEEKNRSGGVVEVFLVIAATFVTFGYRANAFTIIPVLLAYVWLSGYRKTKKLILTASLTIGLALVSLFPKILKIDTMSSASAGFVWEIVTAIQRMDGEKQQQYLDYFDEIGGEGSTALAVQSSYETSVNGFIWQGGGLNSQALSGETDEDAPVTVVKKYVEFIIREPVIYLQTKLDFIKRSLGIDGEISVKEWDYNRGDGMGAYGFNDCSKRETFVESYRKANERLGFYTCQPWLVFLISFVLVAVMWLQKDGRRGLYLFVLMLAAFYYGAYLINTQSFEIRYFYPSLYLLMILDVAIELSLLQKLFEYSKRRRSS